MANELALKPCPFCGGESITERRANGWIARCARRFEDCAINGRTHHYGAMGEAIIAWNTRAAEPAADVVADDLLADFIAEARLHASDMPPVIQRDYLNKVLDKLAALQARPAEPSECPFAWTDSVNWHQPVHRAVMASVNLGSWMSAALDDPNVCESMKADIREWFSAGEPMEALCQALALCKAEPSDEEVERVGLAVAKEVEGPDFDPFSNPEAFEFASRIAKAAIAALRGGA